MCLKSSKKGGTNAKNDDKRIKQYLKATNWDKSWLLAVNNFLRMEAASWRWFQQRWEEMKQRLFGESQYHELKKNLKKGNAF